MATTSNHTTTVRDLLENRIDPCYPEDGGADGLPAVDPILVAAMFFCATEAAKANTTNPPTATALSRFVLSKVTSSLGFLDANQVFELSKSEFDGRHILNCKSSTGILEASVYIPSLASEQQIEGLDAAIFEAGVVLNVFEKCLKQPIGPLSSANAAAALAEGGRLFLAGINALLADYREAFAIAGQLINGAVPWTIVKENSRSRELLQSVVKESSVPTNLDATTRLAFRHLTQTAIVLDFVIESLDEHIDQGQPHPDHSTLVDTVTNADPRWIVEPARSMLLETVAYSSNRTAKTCDDPEHSMAHWMDGSKYAWRALMSSRIPRQAKYVAENLAQASKVTSDPFAKKCADAIFCGAYAMGHLWSLVNIYADKLQLSPKEGSDATGFRSADGWVAEWETIPAYNEEPYFVQRFMMDTLKVTSDNIVVNLLAGVLLLEQFLRNSPAKRRKVEGIEELNLLTAYSKPPENVFSYRDRPLLFTEPFLWAYQVLRLAFGKEENGASEILACGYTSLQPRDAVAVSTILELATTPPEHRSSTTYADSFPDVLAFLNVLANKCPEDGTERDYLSSLSSSLNTESFS